MRSIGSRGVGWCRCKSLPLKNFDLLKRPVTLKEDGA
jgi:hypothetical protein